LKRLFTSVILAALMFSCSKQEIPNVDADVIAYDIYKPDVYIMSDLRDPYMGWITVDNTRESEYYFEQRNDSITLHISKDYSYIKQLEKKGYIEVEGRKTKQVTFPIGKDQHHSFRVYN
jgi:hypothetical protein